MNRVVCFHLFNDYSGSPKVLKTVLAGLAEKGAKIDLITSKGEGALSDFTQWPNVRISKYVYCFSSNPAVTMIRYFGVQTYTFFLALRYAFCKDTLFYVNTVLPVGAVLAGRLTRKRVIYHYHENAFAKGAFYRLLARAMQTLASEIICVSDYQRSFLKRKKNVCVIPNAVPASFVANLRPNPQEAFDRKRVLMLGSLKRYKGTMEFIELARRLEDYQFELVLNETQENITAFWKENRIEQSGNLTVHPRQNDVVPFYNRASLVLNLTDKNQAVETFGLTALEAMSAGLPVIVPTVGGIAELVEEGQNGYKIDVQELGKVEQSIKKILADKKLYIKLSENALICSKRYDINNMVTNIISRFFFIHII